MREIWDFFFAITGTLEKYKKYLVYKNIVDTYIHYIFVHITVYLHMIYVNILWRYIQMKCIFAIQHLQRYNGTNTRMCSSPRLPFSLRFPLASDAPLLWMADPCRFHASFPFAAARALWLPPQGIFFTFFTNYEKTIYHFE